MPKSARCGLVFPHAIRYLGKHWLRLWLVSCSVHQNLNAHVLIFFHRCFYTVNCYECMWHSVCFRSYFTGASKFRWNLSPTTKRSFPDNASENVTKIELWSRQCYRTIFLFLAFQKIAPKAFQIHVKELDILMTPEMPGTILRQQPQRKPILSDPGMHHGTCVTQVP